MAAHPSAPHCFFIAPIFPGNKKEKRSPSSRCRCSKNFLTLEKSSSETWRLLNSISKVAYLGGQNQRQGQKQDGYQDDDEVVPAGQHCLPEESHGAGASPVLNGLESAAWSLYKHQGILTIDLGIGCCFWNCNRRKKEENKEGRRQQKSVRAGTSENLSER